MYRKSFSLIEVLVAAVIVALVLIPINASFTRIAHSKRTSLNKEKDINKYLDIVSSIRVFEENAVLVKDAVQRLEFIYPEYNFKIQKGEVLSRIIVGRLESDSNIGIPYLYREKQQI